MDETIELSEEIKKMNDKELESFVRERLRGKKFDMSGYGKNNSCHINNTNILNLFADCGIYDRMKFLYLDAYKGSMILHYAVWEEDEFRCNEEDYSTLGTVDIIIEILNLTINCASKKRRM